MFSPTKSPIKRAPRKESIVKARSASAASMKKFVKISLSANHQRAQQRHVASGVPSARLSYTHSSLVNLPQAAVAAAKKDEKVADSSPNPSRPVSTLARKEGQTKPEDQEQRSQTSVSESSRPKSQRSVSSHRYKADSSGASTPSKAGTDNSKTQHDARKPPRDTNTTMTSSPQHNGGGGVSMIAAHDSVGGGGGSGFGARHFNASPKPTRKVLPKPKPPIVNKKARRTSQTSLHSRSSDTLDVSHRGSVDGEDHNELLQESGMRNGGKVLPKPKPLREWSNVHPSQQHKMAAASPSSRRPILKKRTSLGGGPGVGHSLDEGPEMEQGESLKSSLSIGPSSKNYDYQKADDSVTSASTTFTTLSSGQFRQAESMHRSKNGMIEFDAPLPQPSQTSGMTPSYVQRANTFIERQRAPARRSVGSIRVNQPLLSNQLPYSSSSTSQQQWAPEFPSHTPEKQHSKFVPMQFRTQPANLPGGMRRQSTQMNDSRGPQAHRVFEVSRLLNSPLDYVTVPPPTIQVHGGHLPLEQQPISSTPHKL